MKCSLLIICIVTLILLVCGCIASNSDNKANSTNHSSNANITQIPDSNYSLFTNGNISIRYPSNWTLENGGGSIFGNWGVVTFYPPNVNQSDVSKCSLQISEIENGLGAGTTILDDLAYWDFIRPYTMANVKSYNKNISDPSLTTLAGRPAYIINFSEMMDNKTIWDMVILTVDKSLPATDSRSNLTATSGYAIDYSASKEYYNEYLDDAQYMIESFNISN
jgi:hypothetical protein